MGDILDNEKGEQIKNTTEIAGPNSRLGLKKKITLSDSLKDFSIKLHEDNKLITTWTVTGLEDAIANKYAHLMTGDNATSPKVAFTIGPGSSGIVGISKKVEALFVEQYEEEVVDEQAMYERRKK